MAVPVIKSYSQWTLTGISMSTLIRTKNIFAFSAFLISSVIFQSSSYAIEEDSICAVVKIEIQQEMTIERQAFDARMKITNSLDSLSMDDVAVTVLFEDENGDMVEASSDQNSETAKFFINFDSARTDGIAAVDGSQSIDPKGVADIHWLIVPAPGASDADPNGKLYFVGATLTYNLGGEPEEMSVAPDKIYVKPMPELVLDYFMTEEVYADDAFTDEIEPAVPFTLGVRISNNGSGISKSTKIDSAQPKIVENEQGLVIGFEIIGSYVNDQPANPSLMIDFGDIEPETAVTGRWVMQTTLSGRFTEFNAEFTHASEFGGDMTSLVTATNAHLLVKDVIVDLPGRDTIKDFLAKDGDVYRLYESQIDLAPSMDVADKSEGATFVESANANGAVAYTLITGASSGAIYVKKSDPFSGAKIIKEVYRSDNKPMSLDNVWLSKTRNGSSWNYYINFFDIETTGTYTVIFTDANTTQHAPQIQFIPHRTTYETNPINFIVEATDQDGTTPAISAASLPSGASFADQGNGKGLFSWTPTLNQKGRYEIAFTATDGVLSSSKTGVITVNSMLDTDGDGMLDSWEIENFGDLSHGADEDLDGDGLSNLEEFKNQSDPNTPEVPVIEYPVNMSHVPELAPVISVRNMHVNADAFVTYYYEIYSDAELTQMATSGSYSAQMSESATWRVNKDLTDDSWYYWRVRIHYSGGNTYSPWVNARFFVNEGNNAPEPFAISAPQDGAAAAEHYPQLQVSNSTDPDGDEITYMFEIYADRELEELVSSSEPIAAGGDGTTEWNSDRYLLNTLTYYWRVKAVDSEGAWTYSPVASFIVDAPNSAPYTPEINAPEYGDEIAANSLSLSVKHTGDPDKDEIVYIFQIDKVNTFDSQDLQTSPEIADAEEIISWTIDNLEENTTYYWRIRVADTHGASSDWATSRFFVNAVNEAPTTPVIVNPGHNSWVETMLPQLEIRPAIDADRDSIIYEYELYQYGMPQPVATTEIAEIIWTVPENLIDNRWYSWRVRAKDEHGEVSEWSGLNEFFVNNDGIDDQPQIAIALEGEDPVIPDAQDKVNITWNATDPDSIATISLYYDTDNSGEDGELIVSGLQENAELSNYKWDTSGLPEGSFYVYAVIADSSSSTVSYSVKSVLINRVTSVEYDNTHPDVILTGNWQTSSWESGFYGENYFLSKPLYAPTEDGIIVDNSDPEFTAFGNWNIDTRFADARPARYGNDFMTIPTKSPSAEAVIIDNEDQNVTVNGEWATRADEGYNGSTFTYPRGDDGASLTWNFRVPQSGRYNVYTTWDRLSSGCSANAPYTVHALNGDHEVTMNQWQKGMLSGGDPQRSKWYYLGTFDFADDIDAGVTLTSNSGGAVVADAIYFEPEDAVQNSAEWRPYIPEAGRYQVHAWWPRTDTDAEQGQVSYTIHADEAEDIVIDYKQDKSSGSWFNLGTYSFAAGNGNSITISDRAMINPNYSEEKIFADAVKLMKTTDQPNTLTWKVKLPQSGKYSLSGRWPKSYGSTTKAKFIIQTAEGEQVLILGQKGSGSEWVHIGDYRFTAQQEYLITISDEHMDGRLFADAIRLEKIDEEQTN